MASWSAAFSSSLPSIGAQIGSFILASKDAKSKRMWQEYENKMARIQDAFNQNAITTNQVLAVQRSAAQQFLINKEEQKTLAAVENAAAATGTEGRSVDKALSVVRYNADRAEATRLMDLDNQLAQFTNQRQSSRLQSVLATDYSPIPSPEPLSLMLGLGSTVTENYYKQGK